MGIGMVGLSIKALLADLTGADEERRQGAVCKLEKLPRGYFEDHSPPKRLVVPVLPRLAELLTTHPAPRVRDWCAQLIGESGVAGATGLDALTFGLDDKDRNVVRTCVWALGTFREKAAPALSRLLRHLGNPWLEIRWRVCWTIGQIGVASPRTAKLLVAAFRDPNRFVRGYAVEAFGKIAAPTRQAIARLEEMRNDPDPFVGGQASMALATLRRTRPRSTG